MLLTIVQDLTLEEVLKKIGNLEEEIKMSFEDFQELFFEKKLDTRFAGTFFEWTERVDSYNGYVEDGQLDYAVEEIKDLKPGQVALLTAKRMELLYQLATLRVESINDLAKKTKRDVKNVYLDLQMLRKLSFAKLNKRKGRALIPETLVKEITFLIDERGL